jgi:glc operon protein GlcG
MRDSVGLALARQIVDAAIRDAGRLQVRISVAVVDGAACSPSPGWTAPPGCPPGPRWTRPGRSSSPAPRRLSSVRTCAATWPGSQLFHGMIARGDLVPFGGGVPLIIDGQLAGAVAVSGATSSQDHEIADRAVSAATG